MILKDEQLKELLAELKEGLKSIYGSRLKGVYLYGSYARGEQEEYSDVDLLVVLDEFFLEGYGAEVTRTGYLGSDLSLKYGVTVSKVFVREADWLHKETPFLDTILFS